MADSEVRKKFDRLERALRATGGTIVALSGGVDSTLLALAAHRALGTRALAVTGRSVTLAASELEQAAACARHIGIRHRIVESKEIEIESFGNNPPNRCYFCKDELYSVLGRIAQEEGIETIVDGSNADDADDHRPGMQAARARGVRSPLMEFGLTKADIRALARSLGLPNWDKPAQACLSSRFPYGSRITPEKLDQVARAEAALREMGFRQLRVRHHETVARIEIPEGEIPAVLENGLAEQIVRHVKAAGFVYVTLDLEGFRSGSMNEALAAEDDPPLPVLP